MSCTIASFYSEFKEVSFSFTLSLSLSLQVALRNVRRDAVKNIDKIKKDSLISEDEAKSLSDDIQKLTDSYIKQVDDLFQSKEKVSF